MVPQIGSNGDFRLYVTRSDGDVVLTVPPGLVEEICRSLKARPSAAGDITHVVCQGVNFNKNPFRMQSLTSSTPNVRDARFTNANTSADDVRCMAANWRPERLDFEGAKGIDNAALNIISSSMKTVVTLSLRDTGVKDAAPANLTGLQLVMLDLGHCKQLTHEVVNRLEALPTLKYLILDGLALCGTNTLQALSRLPNLKVVSLQETAGLGETFAQELFEANQTVRMIAIGGRNLERQQSEALAH